MSRFTTFALTLTVVVLFAVDANAAERSRSGLTRQKLSAPLPASIVVDFSKGVSIKDALDFIRDVSDANFHINWKAIEAAGVTQDTQVNFRLRNVTPYKVLSMVLSEAGGDQLAFYIDEGIVEVTTKEIADGVQYTIVYPVQDLMVEGPQSLGGGMGMMGGMMGGMGGMGGGRMGGGGMGGGRMGGGGMGGGGMGGGRMGGGGMGGYGGGMGGYGMGGGGYGMGGMGMGGMGMMGGMGGMGGYGGMGGMGGYGGGGLSGSSSGTSGTSGSGGSQNSADALVDVIKTTIYPKYWTDNKASIKAYQGNLIITAPRMIHEAIGGPID